MDFDGTIPYSANMEPFPVFNPEDVCNNETVARARDAMDEDREKKRTRETIAVSPPSRAAPQPLATTLALSDKDIGVLLEGQREVWQHNISGNDEDNDDDEESLLYRMNFDNMYDAKKSA